MKLLNTLTSSRQVAVTLRVYPPALLCTIPTASVLQNSTTFTRHLLFVVFLKVGNNSVQWWKSKNPKSRNKSRSTSRSISVL